MLTSKPSLTNRRVVSGVAATRRSPSRISLAIPTFTGGGASFLCKNSVHDISRHVRQAIVAARVAVGEAFMVEAHEVEDRRVKIMHVDRVAADVDAVVVGLAIDGAGLYARAGEP